MGIKPGSCTTQPFIKLHIVQYISISSDTALTFGNFSVSLKTAFIHAKCRSVSTMVGDHMGILGAVGGQIFFFPKCTLCPALNLRMYNNQP
jgi:hypothetical protein